MLKNKAVIHVSETFTIRKIDVKDIHAKYLLGEYNNRALPDVKLRSSNATVKLGKDVGKDASSEVYRFIDRGNNHLSVLTTNHALYKHVTDLQNGKGSELPILRCKYCKRSNLKKAIGMPISMLILANQDVAFNVINSFCDFDCMFECFKRKSRESRSYRSPLFMNTEQLIYCMYYRVYPDRVGQSIKGKDDWDLLRENGGTLTDEEFDLGAAVYIPIPSVILLPCKKQYLKFQLKNAREV